MRTILSTINASAAQLEWIRNRFAELGLRVVGGVGHRGMRARFSHVFPSADYAPIAMVNTSDEWTESLDLDEFDEVLGPELEAVLPLTERYPPFGGGSMEAVTRLLYEFSAAQAFLDRLQPDVILFVKEPEAPSEFILYRLAKKRAIPTLMTRAAINPLARVASMNYEDPVLNADGSLCESSIDLGGGCTQPVGMAPKTQEIVDGLRDHSTEYQPDYMQSQQFRLSPAKLLGDAIREQSLMSLTSGGARPSSGSVLKFRLLREYRKHSRCPTESEQIVDRSRTSIYFPLHYQPEQTTMPLGGSMVIQVKALRKV